MMPKSRTFSSPSSCSASAPSSMTPAMPLHFLPEGVVSSSRATFSSRSTCPSVSFKWAWKAAESSSLFAPFAIFGIALVSCFSAEYKSLICSSSRSLIVETSLIVSFLGALKLHLHTFLQDSALLHTANQGRTRGKRLKERQHH